MQRHYEMMCLVPGSMDEAAVPMVKDRLVQLLSTTEATVTFQEDMGRRRLAYPINQQTAGHYLVFEFDAPSTAVQQLNAQLKLDPEILRHLIISTSLKTPEQLQELADRRKQQHIAWEEKIAQGKQPSVVEKVKIVEDIEYVTKPTVDPKVSLEELDKKLDAILDDTDLEAKL
ncbi:MAG: 30S ribosomal protein S6 [Candidatus Kerfeldbacteria bacterium]|nr:30S ribosomal protein S6 [Candidatus Kerfeldbacteria bacterium]